MLGPGLAAACVRNSKWLTAHAGPIVRISPSELLFTTIEASRGKLFISSGVRNQIGLACVTFFFVRTTADGPSPANPVQCILDIYQRCNPGQPGFVKDDTFYRVSDVPPTMVTETDPAAHRRVRRAVDPGFSSGALKQREPVVSGLVTTFVDKLGEETQKADRDPGQDGVDMKLWAGRFTFDVITAMTFSDCQDTLREEKDSVWLRMLTSNFSAACVALIIRRLPGTLRSVLRALVRRYSSAAASRQRYLDGLRRMVLTRLDKGQKDDLFAHILDLREQKKEQEHDGDYVSFLQGQAAALVSGGTETSSTFISIVLYYLLTHQEKLARLQQEVRTTFASEAEIDNEAAKRLPYLHAVIEEGLRILPPASFGLPRVSPGAFIDGVFVPKGVSSNPDSLLLGPGKSRTD